MVMMSDILRIPFQAEIARRRCDARSRQGRINAICIFPITFRLTSDFSALLSFAGAMPGVGARFSIDRSK
jgi:hypothetical protein